MAQSATIPQDAALQSFAALADASTVPPLVDTRPLAKETSRHQESEKPAEKTLLYLAYGSNLAAKAFQGRRNIRPLRAINVVVPSLQLVFDLAGIPYVEPCFANTRRRNGSSLDDFGDSEKAQLLNPASNVRTADDLGWKKGLVGVAYEVTESDFAHIIATEGGGSSYADIEVDCYPLAKDSHSVPSEPQGTPITAHTLFADPNKDRNGPDRRDGWAEPSARYLGLLTSGAAEHDLPIEYQAWLQQLKAYRITTWRQTAGKALFIANWAPFVAVLFAMQRLLVDKNGRVPKWLGHLGIKLFGVMWTSYDRWYKRWFGEGERTIGDSIIA